MKTTTSAIQNLKAVIKEPWCALSIIFLLWISKEAIGKYIFDGAPLADILSWFWVTLSSFTTKPVVQLSMIPLALYMFARGIQRIEVFKRNEINKSENLMNIETQIRKREFELPLLILKITLFQKELVSLEVSVQDFYKRISDYEKDSERWLGDSFFEWNASVRPIDARESLILLSGPYMSFSVPNLDGDWRSPEVKSSQILNPDNNAIIKKIYDPKLNITLKNDIIFNIEVAKNITNH